MDRQLAAHPRDRFGLINEESLTKRDLVAPQLRGHMESIFPTAEYAALQAVVCYFEDKEIRLGPD